MHYYMKENKFLIKLNLMRQKKIKMGSCMSNIKKLRVTSLFFLTFALTTTMAQNVVPATGGEATGTGGIVSYSVGQATYTCNVGANGSVYQGVQQAYEISEITSMDEAKDISLSIIAFPNPTTDNLSLNIGEFELSNLVFQLYDINGKLLKNEEIINKQTNIETINFVSGVYFLKIVKENKEVKTFKIVKR